MNDDALHEHMEALETRLMHQEAAIEELTRTLLDQAQQLRRQADSITRLETMLRGLADTNPARPGDEPPPPHY
ncbi:MAG: SlyX family protein [Gammaproteobacteria bacterium]|jgi:SlyX protein